MDTRLPDLARIDTFYLDLRKDRRTKQNDIGGAKAMNVRNNTNTVSSAASTSGDPKWERRNRRG